MKPNSVPQDGPKGRPRIRSTHHLIRDCLVAVVRSEADLKRLKDEGWYRIPDRILGHRLRRSVLTEITSLAFYQTAGIEGGLPGAIELWGEVATIRPFLRRDLIPEEADHPSSGELYHRVDLSSLMHLSQPIISRRPRRLSFIRTTRSRLLSASTIGDLIIGTEVEERLADAMKRENLDIDRKISIQVQEEMVEVDFGIVVPEGEIGLKVGGHDLLAEPDSESDSGRPWQIIQFSPARVEHDLDGCISQILRLVERMRASAP